MCISHETWFVTTILGRIYNTAASIENSCHAAHVTTLGRQVCWNSNNYNCLVLNVDGSCLGSPTRAGYGGIIWNSAGFFITGFAGYLSTTSDILFAKLFAMHRGLLLAVEIGIEELVCYSDSMLTVKLVTKQVSEYHTYAVLIQDIKDIISTRNFTIHHCLREGNQCADFFAKTGASSNEEFISYASPPEDLIPLIRNDAMGTYFPRA
ncbi:uncharacterized protein [Medicago truncatula]|uniref:uncharacterized protein n=1 Tax=Medicago truncatula TaxID=3880 RepID=UPI0000D6089F|nr:uncharacterized protein LOC112417325 [Medicago truncatula]